MVAASEGAKSDAMPKIISLIKMCQKEEYVNCFRRGELYANRLRYYRDSGIDEYEGAVWHQPDKHRVILNDRLIPPEDFAGPIEMHLDRIDNLHVFCMFAFHSGDFETLTPANAGAFMEKQIGSIDDCIEDFGGYAVAVTRTQEFLRRVHVAMKRMYEEKRILEGRAHFVEYYDPDTFNMEILREIEIPFHKRNEFRHQKEYRIVVNTGTVGRDHRIIDIGDIQDITVAMKTEDIYRGTHISFPEDA